MRWLFLLTGPGPHRLEQHVYGHSSPLSNGQIQVPALHVHTVQRSSRERQNGAQVSYVRVSGTYECFKLVI